MRQKCLICSCLLCRCTRLQKMYSKVIFVLRIYTVAWGKKALCLCLKNTVILKKIILFNPVCSIDICSYIA